MTTRLPLMQKLTRRGTSIGLRIPAHLVETAHFQLGDHCYLCLLDTGDIRVRTVNSPPFVLMPTFANPNWRIWPPVGIRQFDLTVGHRRTADLQTPNRLAPKRTVTSACVGQFSGDDFAISGTSNWPRAVTRHFEFAGCKRPIAVTRLFDLVAPNLPLDYPVDGTGAALTVTVLKLRQTSSPSLQQRQAIPLSRAHTPHIFQRWRAK